jgi:hypothetical protein
MKAIVFSAAGTWNGSGEMDSDDKTAMTTNVFKLFVNVDGQDTVEAALLANEQESVLADANGTVPQCANI